MRTSKATTFSTAAGTPSPPRARPRPSSSSSTGWGPIRPAGTSWPSDLAAAALASYAVELRGFGRTPGAAARPRRFLRGSGNVTSSALQGGRRSATLPRPQGLPARREHGRPDRLRPGRRPSRGLRRASIPSPRPSGTA
ncbi:MAG: hypothetical protein MZU79_04660 [Anaerotruncus sp.]|nr:hypothetical protein [Anaerotruncus sp.]